MSFAETVYSNPGGLLQASVPGACVLAYDGFVRMLSVIAATLLAGCAAPEPAGPPQQPRELAGRAAGAGQRCVLIQQSESLRVSDNDRHTLLYGSGRTLWANQLGPGCGFRSDDILVTEPIGAYYCRGDLVRSIDRNSHIPGPSCVLGDFVPYTRG